jgi:ubiquinone/menaquinone biosynthesis C-methylase UbiE/rhodanese-related sulfurtransferase
MKTTLAIVRLRSLTFLLTCSVVSVQLTGAQEESVRPGVNDSFKKPAVDKFVERFEREGREVYDHRVEIVDQCKIRPGMVVADIGAGTGLFTRLFAQRVGEGGKVFAVDIAKEFVAHVEQTCKKDGLNHVEGIVCDPTSTGLAENSIDLAFISDTYHHFEFPYRTLRSIRQALKPGGVVVLIDFEREEGKSSDWILGHVRAGRKVFQREVELAGFKLVDESDLLTENYFLRFEVTARKTDRGHTVDSTDDIRQLLANGSAALLDVRELREWDAGHLADAQLVPLSDIQAATKNRDELAKELKAKLPENKILYLHCRSGGRVLIAADLLKPFNYDIRPLKLGFDALTQEGFEQEK